MSTTPSTFSGQSQFGASLQQVITRAVGIASLPLNSEQATLTTLNNEHSALQGLDSSVSNLQDAISSLETALTSQSLTSSVSNGAVVSASIQSGAAAGTYSIEVDDLGSYSTALSAAGSIPATDPTSQGISSSLPLTLNLDGTSTTITPASSSLQDLASAINTQAAGQVQATVVNVGSSSSPDYRLSLTAAKLGAFSIDLSDASDVSLIQNSNIGSLASYKVEGLDTALTSDCRTVTLAPGLTVSLLGQSAAGQATTITIRNDPSALASALSSFAGSYNATADLLNQYHGKNGGVLEGTSIVRTLGNVLRQLSNYSSGDPDTALANFGITVDQTGLLSVDTAAFTAAANSNFAGLASTLGGAATGGFLKSATDLLNSIEDPITGSLKTEENNIATQVTAQNTKITNEQARISEFQANITAQMVKADAAIAALESQVSYVNGLFYSITGNNNNPNATSSIA